MTTAIPSSTSRQPRDAISAKQITTLASAIRFLYARPDLERMRPSGVDTSMLKLERMERLLSALGNPHHSIRTVHVAGTVGKGSTVRMIANMLQACGYTVGEFTSPHLVDVRERIQINGEPVGSADFVQMVRAVGEAAESIGLDATFFELITAVGFKHFAEQAVDCAIIEVGLGGRLDCTNVIRPEISIITEINYDHTQILGKSLAEIAREKAGIFKPGVPAVSVEQVPEVEQVLRKVAGEVEAPFAMINRELEFSSRYGTRANLQSQMRVCLFTPQSRFEHVNVPLIGDHQAHNCAASLAAIDTLRTVGFTLPDLEINQGLARTVVPGRMHLVLDRPRVVVDGAHNPVSVGAFMKSVGKHISYDSMICIFGCCADKDIPGMLENLILGSDKVIFTRAQGVPRAAKPEALQRAFSELTGRMSQTAPTFVEALQIANRAMSRDDLLAVTGSFYLVGEAMKYFANRQATNQTASQNPSQTPKK